MSKEFTWTDELVLSYACCKDIQTLEDFKKQFSPKPEWEVLAIDDDGFHFFKTGREDGFWVCHTAERYLVGSFVNDGKLGYSKEIYQVRRLSDGEIFSVGDLHKSTLNTRKDWPPCKITKFIIADDGTMVTENDGNCRNPLHQIEKVKEPIPVFTTEDGVPIFEGMEYWYVSGNSWKLVKCGPAKRNAVDVADGWFFSTKEAAEDYIVENNPCISIKEISEITLLYDTEFLFKQLEKLVKSKIKNGQ